VNKVNVAFGLDVKSLLNIFYKVKKWHDLCSMPVRVGLLLESTSSCRTFN